MLALYFDTTGDDMMDNKISPPRCLLTNCRRSLQGQSVAQGQAVAEGYEQGQALAEVHEQG